MQFPRVFPLYVIIISEIALKCSKKSVPLKKENAQR